MWLLWSGKFKCIGHFPHHLVHIKYVAYGLAKKNRLISPMKLGLRGVSSVHGTSCSSAYFDLFESSYWMLKPQQLHIDLINWINVIFKDPHNHFSALQYACHNCVPSIAIRHGRKRNETSIVILQLKLIKNILSSVTYFGVPTVRWFKSNEMLVGSSAPLQHVTIFAMDLVLLRFPTMRVTIGSAFEWNVKCDWNIRAVEKFLTQKH